MKKLISVLFAALFLISVLSVSAQEPAAEPTAVLTLAERYPVLKVRNPFTQNPLFSYYRFPSDTWFYEPIDLTYFPHETWNKNDWALVGRWGNSRTYNQIIYSDTPAVQQLIHGTDIQQYGYLRNFYLYADLFMMDNYPGGSGSCYIYYSNSIMTGFKESKGIMIDPEHAVYAVTNSYGGKRHNSYSPGSIKHSIEPILELDPSEYAITPETISGSSIGSEWYPAENRDGNFAAVWESLTSGQRMQASPAVKAYRIEIVRYDGVSDIYINGKQVFSMKDGIEEVNAEGKALPSRVSWSTGPILNPEGLTVTCSVGNFYIYGTGIKED